MAAPGIALDGVTKRYGARAVLAPTTLSVPAGGRLALLGPSGCGKSTRIRIVIGLVVPDGGAVRALGEAVTPASAPALRLRMGYVLQDGGLFPHLTAADNVSLMARHLGWDPARIATRLAELASLVRLDEADLRRYPVELSGGQRQRVGLMRATAALHCAAAHDDRRGARACRGCGHCVTTKTGDGDAS